MTAKQPYLSLIGVFLTLILPTSAYSATLITENGQLVGADGITFDGYIGSVRFRDGSCQEIFNGCDEASDIIFEVLTSTNTEAKDLALSASAALGSQVFDANPLFDLDIELTFGCEEGNVALVFCGILTPYDYTANDSVITANFTNRDDNNSQGDTVGSGQGYKAGDSTIPTNPNASDRLVYASWTLTPVPLPPAVWLFATGILGLIGIARRKKAA